MVTDNHYRWDFIGLSTDQKPTPATSPKVVDGSTFYCSDNSKLYVYCKNQWYEKTATGGSSYSAGDGITIADNTISVDLVQTTGSDTKKVMNQKAVTDTINNRLDDLTLLVISETDYENLGIKDPDTLYIITGD